MRLTDTEFAEYCDRLRFTNRTIEIISNIRNSAPSRRVGGGRNNVPGFYPNRNNGFTAQFEFHTLECRLVCMLEHDPHVLECYCQPPAIKLQYLGLSGELVVVWHTPDYFVLRRDRAGWEETKHKDMLLHMAAASPNRYRLVGNRWECPAGEEYSQQLSLHYHVHSSADVDRRVASLQGVPASEAKLH
jgi:putative transposase